MPAARGSASSARVGAGNLRRVGAICVLVSFGFQASASAQQPPGEPSFDVVSVRQVAPEGPWLRAPGMPPINHLTPGRFRLSMATAQYLILYAYQVKELQLVGGPDWLATDRFEINATTAAGFPLATVAEHLPGMLREVLTDRFNLQIHTEKRLLPAYALVREGRNGRPRPGLRPSTVDCDAVDRERFLASQGRGVPVPATNRLPGVTATGGSRCSSRVGPGIVVADGTRVQHLADSLMTFGRLDRMVVDRTNLTGTFDVELKWTPADTGLEGGQRDQTVALPEGPSLFSALQEQLGLKLEPREELLDVIVIDRIERPTPN